MSNKPTIYRMAGALKASADTADGSIGEDDVPGSYVPELSSSTVVLYSSPASAAATAIASQS
jgi:hypothetical protein